MGIPFRNTDYVNNPIGNDRPIYGNELIVPSPTPAPYNCINCGEWDIVKTDGNPLVVRYYQCNVSTPTILEITIEGNAGTRETICVCDFIDNNIQIISGEGELEPQFRACIVPLTPTPTPSVSTSIQPTPTPTPSPTCDCYSFSVVNNGEGQATIGYTDCSFNPQSFLLDPGFGQSFCACNGSITISGERDVVITNYGACVSPTPTPSFTPTPTQSDPFIP